MACQSLLHLSSTQSELGNCNVHYSGFDSDLSTPASVDDQINTNNDSVTGPAIEKCSFQRNTICLPPDIAGGSLSVVTNKYTQRK